MITDKEILIHIGYHKTATTWLQQNLFVSGNNLFEPLSSTRRGHSSIAKHFIIGEDGYLLSPFSNNRRRIRNEVRRILDDNLRFASKVPVISHERLSGNPVSSGFDAKKIAIMLKEHFPNARILIVIREQNSFIFSIFFQYLSVGGCDSIKKFLNTKYDYIRPHFSPNHIDYYPLVFEYYTLFRQEKVLVLPYEMFRDTPSLFIKNIGHFVGGETNVDMSKFKVVYNKKKNHFVTYHLRFLNMFTHYRSSNNYSPLSNNYTQKIGNFAYFVCGLLTPSCLDIRTINNIKRYIINWAGDRYAKSNNKLSELIKMDLSKYGYKI